MSTLTVAQRVDQLNETRTNEYFRNPDRPDGRAFVKRRRQPAELTRAKTRARTAAWRVRMDSRGAPSTYQFAMAVLAALVTTDPGDLTSEETGLVARALDDLVARGFDLEQIGLTYGRVRKTARAAGQQAGGHEHFAEAFAGLVEKRRASYNRDAK